MASDSVQSLEFFIEIETTEGYDGHLDNGGAPPADVLRTGRILREVALRPMATAPSSALRWYAEKDWWLAFVEPPYAYNGVPFHHIVITRRGWRHLVPFEALPAYVEVEPYMLIDQALLDRSALTMNDDLRGLAARAEFWPAGIAFVYPRRPSVDDEGWYANTKA